MYGTFAIIAAVIMFSNTGTKIILGLEKRLFRVKRAANITAAAESKSTRTPVRIRGYIEPVSVLVFTRSRAMVAGGFAFDDLLGAGDTIEIF